MPRIKPIGGYAEVRYNGETLLFRSELTWSFQKFTKKAVAGRDARVHGYTQEPAVPYIEGKHTYDGSRTIKDLEAIEDATVTVRLADGRVLVLRNAFIAGEIKPGGDEGEISIRWEGSEGEELPA